MYGLKTTFIKYKNLAGFLIDNHQLSKSINMAGRAGETPDRELVFFVRGFLFLRKGEEIMTIIKDGEDVYETTNIPLLPHSITSWRAKGIYGYIETLYEKSISLSQIIEASIDNISSTRKGIQELYEIGYLIKNGEKWLS